MRIDSLLITLLGFSIASCSSQNPKIEKRRNSVLTFFDQTTDTNYHFKVDRSEHVVVLSFDVKSRPVCLNSDSAVYNNRLKNEKLTGKIVQKLSYSFSGLNAFMASEFGNNQIKILSGDGEIILDIGREKGNYSFYMLNFANCDEIWSGEFVGTKFLLEIPE